MLALVFMKKISWKFILTFYLPFYFAFGAFYLAYKLLYDQTDCRNCSFCNPLSLNCADQTTLFLMDFFVYTGIALIILSIVVPTIISYRNSKVIETKIFK